MKRITLRLPDQQIETLEQMVEAGSFQPSLKRSGMRFDNLIEKHAARVLKESDQVSFKV